MLYTTLPHALIKNQHVDLIENTFRREEVLYLAVIKIELISLPKNIRILFLDLSKSNRSTYLSFGQYLY